MNILQFIHSSADGYLGCVQIFASMNNMAFNILIAVSQGTGEEIWRSTTDWKPVAVSSFVYFLKMQIYRLYPRPLKPESPEVGPPNCMALHLMLLLGKVRNTQL